MERSAGHGDHSRIGALLVVHFVGAVGAACNADPSAPLGGTGAPFLVPLVVDGEHQLWRLNLETLTLGEGTTLPRSGEAVLREVHFRRDDRGGERIVVGLREGQVPPTQTTFWLRDAPDDWRTVATGRDFWFGGAPRRVTSDFAWVIETRTEDDVGRAHRLDDGAVVDLGGSCVPSAQYDAETERFFCFDPPRRIDAATGDVTTFPDVPGPLDAGRSGLLPGGGLVFTDADGDVTWADESGRSVDPPSGLGVADLRVPGFGGPGAGPVQLLAVSSEGVAVFEDGAFELAFPGARPAPDATIINYAPGVALLSLDDDGRLVVHRPDGATLDPEASLPPLPVGVSSSALLRYWVDDERVLVEYLLYLDEIPPGASSNQQSAIWVLDGDGTADWTLLPPDATGFQLLDRWLLAGGDGPSGIELWLFDAATLEVAPVRVRDEGLDWRVDGFVDVSRY